VAYANRIYDSPASVPPSSEKNGRVDGEDPGNDSVASCTSSCRRVNSKDRLLAAAVPLSGAFLHDRPFSALDTRSDSSSIQ